jgi:hemolysin activation/secretion protein
MFRYTGGRVFMIDSGSYAVESRWRRGAVASCVVMALGLGAGAVFAQAPTPAAASPAPAQAAALPRFDILEYRVEGNSLINDETIELAVMPHMGEGRTLQDVEGARAALEKRYHDAGWLTVLVSIPEQQVTSGTIALRVTEASVSRLRVVGSQFTLPSAITQRLPQVAEGSVPNFTELQKSLADVNRSGDLKVAPLLKPGKAPGTVEVQLDVDDQLPLHGSVEVNNRQSPNTTATRLSASLRYDNLFQRGHSFGLSVQTSPQNLKETRALSLNYLLPLGTGSDALTAYVVSSKSNISQLVNFSGTNILGNTQIVGLRYSRPLDSSPTYVQSLSAGLDYKHIEQSVNFSGSAGVVSPALGYAPVTLSYRGVWPQDQPQPGLLDVSAVMGLRGLLNNKDSAFNTKQPGASASFVAVRSSLQLHQMIGKWSLASKLDWQLASGPLLPSEKFSAGGADSVRGYLEGEGAGDGGFRFSFELATPSIKVEALPGGWRLVGLAFVDEAILQTIQPGLNEPARASFAGTGVGLRVNGLRGQSLQLDVARALINGNVTNGGTSRGAWRVHARLGVEF